MAKIYSGVKGIEKPEFAADWEDYNRRVEAYITATKDWAKSIGGCPETGKEIRFPVADGCARYVILGLRPVELIHLDVGDGYRFQYINRLTAADIRRELHAEEALNKIFAAGRTQ